MVGGNYIQFYYYNLNFENLSSEIKVLCPRDTHQSTQEVRFRKVLKITLNLVLKS